MPAAQWPLQNHRPEIHVVMSLLSGGHDLIRRLVADTGAGSRQSVFQLVLLENDCLQCQGLRITIGYSGNLGGLYVFVLYSIAGLE